MSDTDREAPQARVAAIDLLAAVGQAPRTEKIDELISLARASAPSEARVCKDCGNAPAVEGSNFCGPCTYDRLRQMPARASDPAPDRVAEGRFPVSNVGPEAVREVGGLPPPDREGRPCGAMKRSVLGLPDFRCTLEAGHEGDHRTYDADRILAIWPASAAADRVADGARCPACGQPIKTLNTYCAACGHDPLDPASTKETPMPDPFTDEDRARVMRLADRLRLFTGNGNAVTDAEAIDATLAHIDQQEKALRAADELEALSCAVLDRPGWDGADRKLDKAVDAYRSVRAALPEKP